MKGWHKTMEEIKVPMKRVFQLAVEQAYQNWKTAYNKLQDEPKSMMLVNREKIALEEYIDFLKAQEDFERGEMK